MRNVVIRADGKHMHATRTTGQLFVCADGCCCGRTDLGLAAVPRELYHTEWLRRRFRSRVHLTVGGCLGPCSLANVVLLLWQGRALWFHSINSEQLVLALFDYIDQLLDAERFLPPPPVLETYRFTASTWEERPDGEPVEDRRPRWSGATTVAEPAVAVLAEKGCVAVSEPGGLVPDRLVAQMDGAAAAPRKNGELVFQAPWEGRIFGMAVALHEGEILDWDEFRACLIAEIGAATARGEVEVYYERWLAAFEGWLVQRGLIGVDELAERTEEFEFGERDELF